MRQVKKRIVEHSPGMMLCGEDCECLCGNSKTANQESCDLGFFKNVNCSWNVFWCPSQVWWVGMSLHQISP